MVVLYIDHLEVGVGDGFAAGWRKKLKGARGSRQVADVDDIGLVFRS